MNANRQDIWNLWLTQVQPETTYQEFDQMLFIENETVRSIMQPTLTQIIYDYHSQEDRTAELLCRLGYSALSTLMNNDNRPKATSRTKTGHFLEVIATEYIINFMNHHPVLKRLRFNPNPEQAMKGDDLLAFEFEGDAVTGILVGEAKYRSDKKYITSTVHEAYQALTRTLSPLPLSLQFVINLLEFHGEKAMANRMRDLKQQLASENSRVRKSYLLFVGSIGRHGDPFLPIHREQSILDNLTAVNVVFAPDIQEFIDAIFQGMGS